MGAGSPGVGQTVPPVPGPQFPPKCCKKIAFGGLKSFSECKQVAKNCPWQSQVTPEWKKCAPKLLLAALIAKQELQKMPLAV